MAQHDRNLLKKSDIERFMKWLDGDEWRVGKGEYQLMQIKLAKGWGAICIDASGVITTPTEIAPLIKQFKAGKPRVTAPSASTMLRTMTQKQFDDELRDDFAIAALQGLLAGGGPAKILGGHEENNQPEKVAALCYAYADAMLAERKKSR